MFDWVVGNISKLDVLISFISEFVFRSSIYEVSTVIFSLKVVSNFELSGIVVGIFTASELVEIFSFLFNMEVLPA